LGRRKFVVKHDNVGVDFSDGFDNLVELPGPDVGFRVRVPQVLRCRTDDFESSSFGKASKLFKRRFGGPVVSPVVDADEKCTLGW